MPQFADLHWEGLESFSRERFSELARVDAQTWKEELASHDELFGKLGAYLPAKLEQQRKRLHQLLGG
jgi:phosphoenolpyruvate carboxykinase (GTP)